MATAVKLRSSLHTRRCVFASRRKDKIIKRKTTNASLRRLQSFAIPLSIDGIYAHFWVRWYRSNIENFAREKRKALSYSLVFENPLSDRPSSTISWFTVTIASVSVSSPSQSDKEIPSSSDCAKRWERLGKRHDHRKLNETSKETNQTKTQSPEKLQRNSVHIVVGRPYK